MGQSQAAELMGRQTKHSLRTRERSRSHDDLPPPAQSFDLNAAPGKLMNSYCRRIRSSKASAKDVKEGVSRQSKIIQNHDHQPDSADGCKKAAGTKTWAFVDDIQVPICSPTSILFCMASRS
jgi:hypothetical protein